MKVADYIKSRGISVRLVAQEAKISTQAVYGYCVTYTPTANTLRKIAGAMTRLGVETTAADIFRAMEE